MRLGPAGLIEVVSPFDAVTHAQLRAVRPPGRWLPRRGCWEFPFEAAAILERLSDRGGRVCLFRLGERVDLALAAGDDDRDGCDCDAASAHEPKHR